MGTSAQHPETYSLRVQLVILIIATAIATSVRAQDVPASSVPESSPPPAKPTSQKAQQPASRWSVVNRLSGALTQTDVQHAADSRDPAIQNQKDSWSYLISFEHTSTYDHPDIELKNTLAMKYGQTELRYTDSTGARIALRQEIQDSIGLGLLQSYRVFPDPRALYSSETYESAFTGAVPGSTTLNEDYLHPQLLKLAVGYRDDPVTNLKIRLGIRGQNYLDDSNADWEWGLEGIADYTTAIKKDLSYTGKFEVFTEFNDINHIAMRFNNTFRLTVTHYLTFELTALFYYETNPNDVLPADEMYYNTLSWKETSRLSVVLAF